MALRIPAGRGDDDLRLYHGAAVMRSASVTGGAAGLAATSEWRTTVLRGGIPSSSS